MAGWKVYGPEDSRRAKALGFPSPFLLPSRGTKIGTGCGAPEIDLDSGVEIPIHYNTVVRINRYKYETTTVRSLMFSIINEFYSMVLHYGWR